MNMKLIFTLSLFIFASLSVKAQTTCENATVVIAGINNAAFSQGSQSPAQMCYNSQPGTNTLGAWYKYTPDDNYIVTLTTLVADYPALDTRVNIYSGSCDNLICVGGDDDGGGSNTSLVNFNVTQGTTYYFAFDNRYDSSDFVFNLIENEIIIGFTQQAISITQSNNLPRCIVDMNGDYLDDIVDVSGNTVHLLLQNTDRSGFSSVSYTIPDAENSPSWSIAAGDYDKNGFNDLLYGGGGGASIILAGSNGTGFSNVLNSTGPLFSQRSNFVDINNDGNLDAFVCHDLGPNIYFQNDGNEGFTFHAGGLGDFVSGGNYGSIWIDYDNDGDTDLFIAKCRGGGDMAAVDELHRNNGDGTFTNIAQEAGLADLHQSWSAAWGDYDNDGDMDVMVGNSSGAWGEADPNDPLNQHKLMKNNGDGTFTNITAGSGFDTFTTPNLVHVAHDFDNDGFTDIFCGGNTIMHNNGDLTFSAILVTAETGPVGDLNNDGFLDIQNENHIYLNIPNDNNWIKINLRGVASNGNGIGARIELHGSGNGWETQIRDVKSGDGFYHMSTLNTHFGIGNLENVDRVVIKWPSGTVDVIQNPTINSALLVVEGSHIMGLKEGVNTSFAVYPNPAKEVLNIKNVESLNDCKASVYSVDGKLIKSSLIENGAIPVQQLAKGTYIIKIQDKAGKQYSAKFIKG
jgi:hypothetical protein